MWLNSYDLKWLNFKRPLTSFKNTKYFLLIRSLAEWCFFMGQATSLK
jgi:hypothetical protein